MPHIYFMRIFATRTYDRAIRRLLSDESRMEMEAAIAADPTGASVIPGTGGIRKMRWRGFGRGKRGGIRTIYFLHTESVAIYLLTAYSKAARDDLSPADKKALKSQVAAIKEQEKAQ